MFTTVLYSKYRGERGVRRREVGVGGAVGDGCYAVLLYTLSVLLPICHVITFL